MKKLITSGPLRFFNLRKIIIFMTLAILLINQVANAQDAVQKDLDVITNFWLQYSDAPNSLYHYIADQAFDLLAQRSLQINSLNSLSDWQQRQKKVHETLFEIVGPFPDKTPLNAKVTRVVEKDSFRVEHIVYESQPGFYVTSSLFMPKGIKKGVKSPVVIYCSGHSADGYRNLVYQHVILNLVRKGFIVFAFDPVGQGERVEYIDKQTNKSKFNDPTMEHSYPGTQAFVVGSSEARYMIWDGIRAVDYLLTRKEVDPARIGITGRSGGGTQSAYIAAFDDRIYAAAPECYITNFTRLLQTIGNQDAEQNLLSEIKKGIDHADLLEVRAPKPALMINTTRDFFSIQGARETEKEVSAIYKSYGKEENFSRVEDDSPHASTKKNREAMYSFFQEHLKNAGSLVDEPVRTLTAAELQVTTTGQVCTSYNGETVFSLNRKEAEKLMIKLQASREDIQKHRPEILNSAKLLSGYQEPKFKDEPVFTGRFQREGYVIEKYFLKGEGTYIIPYLLMIPSNASKKGLIYLDPAGKSAAAGDGGELEWFVKNGFTVIAPDLIGVGEMGPGIFQGDSFIEGDSHNIWYASLLIGRSIVGIRAADVVRLAHILKSGIGVSDVYAVAKKEMAPVLIHAAAFDESISHVALIDPFSSYQSIVINYSYKSSFISGVVPSALTAYDLPDLASCLAPRKLLIAGVTDGNGGLIENENNNEFAVIRKAYNFMNADKELLIQFPKPFEKPYNIYNEWIK